MMNDQEREEMLDRMQREVFSSENDDPRNVELREQQAEIKQLRKLIAEAIQDPERVSLPDDTRGWELLVRDGWMKAAQAAGGKDDE